MSLSDFAAQLRIEIPSQRNAGTAYFQMGFNLAEWLLNELQNLSAANRCDCGGSEVRCCSCGKYILTGGEQSV